MYVLILSFYILLGFPSQSSALKFSEVQYPQQFQSSHELCLAPYTSALSTDVPWNTGLCTCVYLKAVITKLVSKMEKEALKMTQKEEVAHPADAA
jgi:type II secretory pathway component PulK